MTARRKSGRCPFHHSPADGHWGRRRTGRDEVLTGRHRTAARIGPRPPRPSIRGEGTPLPQRPQDVAPHQSGIGEREDRPFRAENDAEEIGGRRRQRRTTGVPPQPGSAGRIDALEIPVIDASAPFQPNDPRSREALFHLATVTMSLKGPQLPAR
ncbi:hypothetical protein STXM2123_3661 [Streptomyces sp. F-3]|nr:hypothetical protein STXM2123_3661 [Streptomyces sp. F-3]